MSVLSTTIVKQQKNSNLWKKIFKLRLPSSATQNFATICSNFSYQLMTEKFQEALLYYRRVNFPIRMRRGNGKTTSSRSKQAVSRLQSVPWEKRGLKESREGWKATEGKVYVTREGQRITNAVLTANTQLRVTCLQHAVQAGTRAFHWGSLSCEFKVFLRVKENGSHIRVIRPVT